ncbi:armadillo-type protein [Umbelopsis sp. PMI_123]|nr:armadillo-type protein [Umbelopsis sp. PMI_123]
MTLARFEDVIEQLQGNDPVQVYRALKTVKNSIIGNRTKKAQYANSGIIQRLVELLSPANDVSEDLRMQAATILGSFAHGNDEIVSQIVAAGAIPKLLSALALPSDTPPVIAVQQNIKMLEASTRALKAIYSSGKSDKKDIYTNNNLDNIMTILNVTTAAISEEANQVSQIASLVMIAELTTSIIARCCTTHEEQTLLSQCGVVEPLAALLHSGYAKAQEAALDAFSSLCRENIEISRASLNARAPFGQMTLTTMLDLVRDKSQSMRLAAATCLTNIYRADVFPEPFSDIVLVVLPTLIKLLKEDNTLVQEKAPLIMADLVKDSETMQKAAYEADAIPNLASILASVSKEDDETNEHRIGVQGSGGLVASKEKVKENCLISLAAVCLLREECRTQAINSKILPYAVAALSSYNPAIRLAACQCIKSLSRSVRHLRTHLVDAGVISPLLKLLDDGSPVVQAAACGSLCNMILDFSPMKKTVIEEGGLTSFVKFTHSDNAALKLNSVWSLKNLLYSADSEIKRTVMQQLGYDYLIELLNDPSLDIQEQALDLVRNLACGTKEDIDDVFNGIGENQLLDILERRLANSMMIDEGVDNTSMTLEPALYTLVNIAVGSSQHKSALLKRPELMQSIVRHMSHEKSSIRSSTAWCIINLTWADNEDKVLPECFGILKDLGVEEKLRIMEEDPERDVRDRARTALSQLTSLSDMQEE